MIVGVKGARRHFVFLFLLFISFSLKACHTPGGAKAPVYFKIIKVIDGDTFWIDDGSEKGRKIRLIGVDAPETKKTFRKEVGFYGNEAKNYLTSLLSHKEVRLDYDVDRKDRYGRTLAYVYLKDGTFVNAELVSRGYAMVLTVPPNVRFADVFVELQREARKNRRGLWKNGM